MLHQAKISAPANTQAPLRFARAYERVSISCPHCWGTGDMRLFDNLESRDKRDCIFCNGTGMLHVALERAAVGATR